MKIKTKTPFERMLPVKIIQAASNITTMNDDMLKLQYDNIVLIKCEAIHK